MCDPSGYIPLSPDETSSSKSEDVVTHINSQKQKKPINVQGKIDLSALNSSIRPQRKSKEERFKERENRKDKSNSSSDTSNKQNNSIGFKEVKEIWKRFVDIQEKLIRQRCSPISIKTDSIEI